MNEEHVADINRTYGSKAERKIRSKAISRTFVPRCHGLKIEN
ncbi:MAG: hypothetical protein QGF59_29640 [Pirellulaceae bacterium]|nr:hypothetical protein [Pirellulaceae bacterium]